MTIRSQNQSTATKQRKSKAQKQLQLAATKSLRRAPSSGLKRRTKAQLATDRARAERIAEVEVDFIPNAEFEHADAAQTILGSNEQPAKSVRPGVSGSAPAGVPAYLASLYETRLLTAAEEADLFRRMNFLKYRAALHRAETDLSEPDPRDLEGVENDLAAANQVRNVIIQSNLRLVVSIAKRYVDDANSFTDLVSDGNVSLMRAVEKFNYGLGYRFSTYATWAIRKNFNRSTAKARQTRHRFMSAADDALTSLVGNGEVEAEVRSRNLRPELDRILGRLAERERGIVMARFGLDQGTEPRTLKDIAGDLGVCKERIRQLELRALRKLHDFATEDHLEPPEGN